MKSMAIALFTTLLAVASMLTTVPQTTVQAATFPYKMAGKTFTLETLHYNSCLISYSGAEYLNLSFAVGSFPMGIVYDKDKNCVWLALYQEGGNPDYVYGVAKIDVDSKNVTIYRFPFWIDNVYAAPKPWTIAVVGDELWISIKSCCKTPGEPPSAVPFLAKLNPITSDLTIYYIPAELGIGNDIKFHENFVWYQTGNGLSKINQSTQEIVEFYSKPFSNGGFMRPDGDCIWLTSADGGYVARFNITSNAFDLELAGFDRPSGLEIDADFVYVAENSDHVGSKGTVAKINKTSLQVARVETANITNGGPVSVLKDSFGYLWFTDSSKHFGIVGGVVFDAISPYCFFMTEVPGGSIWLSVKGSTYVGIVEQQLIGDVNADCKVDMKDVGMTVIAFGSMLDAPNWNPNCDVNKDNKVDMKDVGIVVNNFGKTL